jgi:hypothetical protein
VAVDNCHSGQVYSYIWNGDYNYPNGSHFFSGPITLPTAGVYTITDVPAGTETGALQFTLYTVPPAATANLTVGGSATTLSTTTPGQTFAPTFTGTANERITLLVDNISGTLGTLGFDGVTITGPTGVVYPGGSFNSNENPLFSGLITLPATGAGTYTISDVPSFTETGQASFHVVQVPADPTSAISIGGKAVTLSTTTAGQRIVLTFTNSTNQTISLAATNLTGCLAGQQFSVVITAPDGSLLYNYGACCGETYFYSGNLVASQIGTYTVILTPTNMNVGGATFQLYQETALTSTLTPGGGSVGVSTTAPQQTMNLTMPETSGHRVAVLVQFSGGLLSQDTLLNIVAPDGSTSIWSSNTTPGSSLWTGALPKGNVTSTTPLLTQTGNYALSLQEVSGVGTGNATFTAYDVPADLAGTVSVGHNATFNVTTPGQGLRATFAGTANAKATFNVAPTSVTPTSACFNVTVLEPDGVTVLNSGQACSGAYSTGSQTLPTTGNYLVVAVPNVPATGTFTVGVTSP